MKKISGPILLSILLGVSVIVNGEQAVKTSDSPENHVSVTIVYDNYQLDNRLKPDWGFACLIEFEGQKILFDAGSEDELYKKNMGLLGIKPEEIPTLFISHEHGDHTAGVPWIIESNPSVNCYLPSSYAAQLRARGTLPPNNKSIAEPSHLFGPFYTTGDDFDSFNEQGLIVKTENGGILITGCGHPGPIEMIKTAKEELGIEIYAIIGGLHLMRNNKDDVEEIAASLKEAGIKQICPTHCTGDQSISILAESFGNGYIPGGTGQIITIK